MSSSPSAPRASARRLFSSMVWVELDPVPAITGTRPCAASMTQRRTASSSSWVMVELSPVVPRARMASVPLAMCHWVSSLSLSKFTEPSAWKGVTRATMEPFRLRMSISKFPPSSVKRFFTENLFRYRAGNPDEQGTKERA